MFIWDMNTYNQGQNQSQHPVQGQIYNQNQSPVQGQVYNQGQNQIPRSPYRYPRQVSCVKREEINLYSELVYRPATNDELINGEYPGMDVFGKTRFDIYMFKYAEKKSIKYCLNTSAVKLIYEKTKAIIDSSVNKKQDKSKTSPAYTVAIKGGGFYNKTAAEILLENPQMRNKLLEQRDFYEQASLKNPKFKRSNDAMVQAINEAVIAFDNGKLEAGLVNARTILYCGMKTPNPDKKDGRGLIEVRQIEISYSPAAAMPFTVSILNGMAPPTSGQVGAKMEQVTDKTSWQMNLMEEEWFHFINEMNSLTEECRSFTLQRRWNIYNSDPYATR